MRKILEEILQEFRPCFSREAAFYWFTLIIFGLIIRLDHAGVTSIIRWLFLEPACYEAILHFFHSSAWDLSSLLKQWAKISLARYPAAVCNGRRILLGDSIKTCAEWFLSEVEGPAEV